MLRPLRTPLWITLFTCLLPALCRADGFIIITEPPIRIAPVRFAFAPLEVTYHRVSVQIDDQVAVTKVEQEFYNPNPQRMEGTYIFPLPEGSHIDKFSMDVNGNMMDAELLPADKARAIYEDIVRRYKDPALLEYMGRDAFRVRIFPIEPNGRKQIRLQYTQLLKNDTGLIDYTYPLNTEKFSSKPLGDVSVNVQLNCTQPLKSVYSPTHNVQITRDGDRRATVAYAEKNARPDTDFKLIFSRSGSPVGIDLLTFRDGPDDGTFLLLAAAGTDDARAAVQSKDVCFVLDTSGSMAGPKMEQARKALNFCLASLNEGDRFNILRFSTEPEPLFPHLQPANKANVEKATSFVAGLKASGGTAIFDALQQAMAMRPALEPHDKYTGEMKARDSAPYVIVFLTDGQPTIGETGEDAIVNAVDKSGGNSRVFCFGIGTDVNTHLLDRIAAGTRAFSQYVLPEEDIEVKVSNFYAKIREPALTDVAVAFDGADVAVSQVYPATLPDLYKGEMLTVFGRYHGKGPGSVRISGMMGGEKKQFASDVTFAEHDVSKAFIPYLWAARRVGWLMDQIRLHGESAELKDEVTSLARRYGIVTPYTAYLIMEDEQNRNVPMPLQSYRELRRDEAAFHGALAGAKQEQAEASDASSRTGGGAVQNARDVETLRSLQNQAQAAAPAEAFAKSAAGPSDGSGAANSYREPRNYAQQARVVNGRAFYLNGSVWTDSTAQAARELKSRKIAFNSEEYFALVHSRPQDASCFALGDQIDIVIDGSLVEIR